MIPTQQSSHGSLDGRTEKFIDREVQWAITESDSRWRDEDHYTNRSGDPRIGTHGRTYEGRVRRDEEA